MPGEPPQHVRAEGRPAKEPIGKRLFVFITSRECIPFPSPQPNLPFYSIVPVSFFLCIHLYVMYCAYLWDIYIFRSNQIFKE